MSEKVFMKKVQKSQKSNGFFTTMLLLTVSVYLLASSLPLQALAEELKLGIILPFTGAYDNLAKSGENAIFLAMNEQDEVQRKQVEYYSRDHGSNCETAANLTSELITEKKPQIIFTLAGDPCTKEVGKKINSDKKILHIVPFPESAEPSPDLQKRHQTVEGFQLLSIPKHADDPKLRERYKDRYGSKPNASTLMIYDAMKIILKVATHTKGLSAENLKHQFKAIHVMNTIEEKFNSLADEDKKQVVESLQEKLPSFSTSQSAEKKQYPFEIRVSIAPLREQPSAYTKILSVLERGKKVKKVVDDEKFKPQGDWLWVQSLDDPDKQGWIHRLLIVLSHDTQD